MSDKDESRLIKSAQGLFFTTAALAELLGVSDRRIRQLVSEGIIEKSGRGRFNLIKTVQDLLGYWQKVAEAQKHQGDAKQNYEQERYYHEKAKRQMSELKLAAMEGSMHEGEEVERVMTNMLAKLRGKLLTIPTKLAPQLIARDEVAVIQDMLQQEIHEALQELSEYDPSMFRSKQYVEIDEDEEEVETSQVRGDEQQD